MSEFVLVRDDGFHPHDGAEPVVLAPDTDPATLGQYLNAGLIAVEFPAMTDGRGFSLARILRELGFAGCIRATLGVALVKGSQPVANLCTEAAVDKACFTATPPSAVC